MHQCFVAQQKGSTGDDRSERLQRWLFSQRFFSKRRQRVERLWNRYGLIGVAFQSPVFAGTLLSTLVALGLGAPARTLLFWISVSLVFWGGVLTGAVVLGFSVFESWRASVDVPFLGHATNKA